MSLLELAFLAFLFNLETFGNGPTMVPLLQSSLVEARHVLTQDQLLYAFTIARVTPGQANVYVASVGMMLFGIAGAVVTTLAILLPGYAMIPALKLRERWKGAPAVEHFTRGLTSTSVGLIFAAVVSIAASTLHGWIAWVVFVATLVLLQVFRWNPVLSIALGGALGLLLFSLF